VHHDRISVNPLHVDPPERGLVLRPHRHLVRVFDQVASLIQKLISLGRKIFLYFATESILDLRFFLLSVLRFRQGLTHSRLLE